MCYALDFSGDFLGVNHGGMNMYDMTMASTEYGALPLSTSSSKMSHHEIVFPSFCQSAVCDRSQPVKFVEGELTTFNRSLLGATRKRTRDSVNYECGDALVMPQKIRPLSLDRDISLDICQQQSELNRLIAQYTQRMRLEIEEKARRQTKEVLAVIQQEILRRLREKDEEIQRMGKLNLALQERIKTLSAENQLLRGLAQTSEAAANSLRINLEQVLAITHAAEDRHISPAAAPMEADAESCCGSSTGKGATEDKEQAVAQSRGGGRGPRRACRGCGEKEPCVLLLPCRHLCLCTACGSSVRGCPICGSVMTGTVHVNMS